MISSNGRQLSWVRPQKHSHRAYLIGYQNGNILVGQSNEHTWIGLGGGREKYERYPWETVLREWIEECFGWSIVHLDGTFFIDQQNKTFIPYEWFVRLALDNLSLHFYFTGAQSRPKSRRTRSAVVDSVSADSEIIYLVTFEELDRLLEKMDRFYGHLLWSPFYPKFPKNVFALIHTRVIPKKTIPEVERLASIHMEELFFHPHVDDYFRYDLAFLKSFNL